MLSRHLRPTFCAGHPAPSLSCRRATPKSLQTVLRAGPFPSSKASSPRPTLPSTTRAMPGRRLAKVAAQTALDKEPQRQGSDQAEDGQRQLLDLKGLKRELQRQQSRALKKSSKAHARLHAAQAKAAELLESEDASLADLEACPDTGPIEEQVEQALARIAALAELEGGLAEVKSAKDPKYPALCLRAQELGVSDQPPPRPQRGPKKPKGKQPPPRKPYWTFASADGIEIRVGRAAADNDALSCNPKHRDGQDWWMHAAGCPGSHVVIRSHEDLSSETIADAAVLAAAYSKATQSGKAGVSLVRCRQVSKPHGAKPGLVRLSGDVATVKVNVKAEADRLKRLESTKST